MRKTKIVCSNCGSENVARDAWAYWDFKRQEWEISSVFDEAYCFDCDGPMSLDEIETEEDDNAQILSHDDPLSDLHR